MSKGILNQSQNRPMILLLLSLAMFMVILDSAIINVALPDPDPESHYLSSRYVTQRAKQWGYRLAGAQRSTERGQCCAQHMMTSAHFSASRNSAPS